MKTRKAAAKKITTAKKGKPATRPSTPRTVPGQIDIRNLPLVRDVLLRNLEWVPSPIARAVGRHMDRHTPLCATPRYERDAHAPLMNFLTQPHDGGILATQVESFLNAYRACVIWAWGYAFPRLTIHAAPLDLIRRQMIELRLVLEKSCGRAPKTADCLIAAQHMVMLDVVNVAAASAIGEVEKEQTAMLAATARSVAEVMAYWNPEDLSFQGKDSLQIGAEVLKRLCVLQR